MRHQLVKKIYIAFLISAGFWISCSGNKNQDKADTAIAEEPKESMGILALTEKQMQSVDITVGPIEKKNLSAVVKASGQLAVPPQNKADVSVLYGGLIHKIYVLEGQQVKRGQVLATIENQDLIKIQQDYLSAKNNFNYIQAEYNRQKQLKEAGAGTGKSMQSSEATFYAERSRIKAYESQLLQLGISSKKITNGNIVSHFPLLSPISGTVGQILANTGAFLQPGTSIMEVVDNSKIHCDLLVFEKDLMKIKIGQKVDLQLTNQENQEIQGTINGINKSFENESKGVIVHAVIENPAKQNLIPGMYVTALIGTGNQLAYAVPVEAVIRSEGKQFIFIQVIQPAKKEKKLFFKKAEVITGVSELGYTEIKPVEELPADVRVIKKGAFYLQSMGMDTE